MVKPRSRVFLRINRFWGRRPDGVAINESLKIVDRDEGFLEVKDAEANE